MAASAWAIRRTSHANRSDTLTSRRNYMGILEGKNILVTGVLTEGSIAFDVARLCRQEGATVVLTGMGRTLKVTQAMGRRLPVEALAVELDVTNPEQLASLVGSVTEHVPHLDGVVHSIGFAP